MKNKISIIVPVYKVPSIFLDRCINSLINQTYKNIEILLVDDGSPDECPKICDKYAKIDDRIIVIHKKNKGLSSARNSGVKECTGEYIMFVDGDDWLENNACQILLNNIEPDIDVLCASFIKDYGKKQVKYNYNLFENQKKYMTDDELLYMRRMVLNYKANISSVTAKLIRKKIIDTYDIYHNEELKQGAEGIDFVYRLFKYSKGVKFINDYVYYYVYNCNSITTNFSIDNAYMILNCFNEIKKNINPTDELFFDNRLLYVIVTSVTGGYLSSRYDERYDNRISKLEKFLNEKLLVRAINNNKAINMLDIKRKLIIILLKHKQYKILYFITKIRNMLKGEK